jgi:AcrR family transcriptional regulator
MASPTKIERLTPRSAATRAKLIAVAERLFATKGVEAVSLNEINRVAGQRNSNACQYHFGNKEGLIRALLDKHMLAVMARRNELLDRLDAKAEIDIREAVQAFSRPVAEKLYDPDGGKEYIRINAQLIVPEALLFQRRAAGSLQLQGADRLSRVLRRSIAHLQLPDIIEYQRFLMAALLLFHGLADHSQMLDETRQGDATIDTDLFLNMLEDAMIDLLSQPASAATLARARELTETR